MIPKTFTGEDPVRDDDQGICCILHATNSHGKNPKTRDRHRKSPAQAVGQILTVSVTRRPLHVHGPIPINLGLYSLVRAGVLFVVRIVWTATAERVSIACEGYQTRRRNPGNTPPQNCDRPILQFGRFCCRTAGICRFANPISFFYSVNSLV